MRTKYDVTQRCPNCGATELEWGSAVQTRSGILDGRLNVNELTPVFYLGCKGCSETIATLSGDDVAEILNGRKK
jgi:hypothetical protein